MDKTDRNNGIYSDGRGNVTESFKGILNLQVKQLNEEIQHLRQETSENLIKIQDTISNNDTSFVNVDKFR